MKNGAHLVEQGGASIPLDPDAKKMKGGMIEKQLLHLGVLRAQLDTYYRRPDRENAYVVGLADPTDSLPAGHIFVTGLPQLTKAFVAGNPCVAPGDGNVFPVVSRRPRGMSSEAWEWLRALPFGGLIFSSKGDQPLPALCAQGDLDGDLYFVCWSEDLLEGLPHRDPSAPLRVPADQSAQSAKRISASKAATDGASSGSWLAAVQAHITDAWVLLEVKEIGRLCNEWKKVAEEHGLEHPDAIALGRAYEQSLERGKHGVEVQLPEHLQRGKAKGGKAAPHRGAAGPSSLAEGGRGSPPPASPPTPGREAPPPARVWPGEKSAEAWLEELQSLSLADLRTFVKGNGLSGIVKTHVGRRRKDGGPSRCTADVARDVAAALASRS